MRAASHAHLRRTLLTALIGATLPACGTDGEPPPPPPGQPADTAFAPATVDFDTATISFVTDGGAIEMNVEVAAREDQRSYGLMDRDHLPDDAGMIFLYDEMQPAGSGFWMYRTRIPLDIAFFDGAGRIVAIRQMMPCPSPDPTRCQLYTVDTPFFGAVEANRGYFARHGIGVGDTVVLPGRAAP